MCVKPKLAMGRFELLNNKYDGNCKSYTICYDDELLFFLTLNLYLVTHSFFHYLRISE